jgi:polar amino acid transport system substrate-binding protein
MSKGVWCMGKLRLRLLACLAALFCDTAAAEPLRVCTVIWPPHTVVAADGRTVQGAHTETVSRAMRAAGYEIAIDAVSWERCLRDVAEGYYAAAYAASFRDDRAAYAVYPRDPIDSVRYVAVVRKGEGNGWNRQRSYGALPQPISAPRAWAVTDDLRRYSGVQIEDSSTHNEQDIRKLLAGRVGSSILEARTARKLLAELDLAGRLEILDEPIQSDRKYYMIFSRKALGDEGARLMAERFSNALSKKESR